MRLVTEPSRPASFRDLLDKFTHWSVLGSISVILSLLAVWLFLLQRDHFTLTCSPSLTGALSHPRYLSVGDVGRIDLTLANQSTQPITVTAVISMTAPLQTQTETGMSTSVTLADLAPGAGQSMQARLRLNAPPVPMAGGQISFDVWTRANGVPAQCQAADAAGQPKTSFVIQRNPIPAVESAFNWFRLTPLALFGAALWSLFRKGTPLE
ncbi:MAG: hypothetical protein HY784_14375 [Chloroflexi bacterium]|nr:hypothetical protein [Chloroflexota bacterium]